MAMTGQVCIVTGASRGIGRATVMRLCRSGAQVIAAARTQSTLDKLVLECEGLAKQVLPQPCDVTDPEDVQALIERCRSEFSRLDVLINNAGTAPLSPVASMRDEDFDTLYRMNIESVFHLTRAAWPLLKKQGGTIINVSSQAAVDPFPGFAAYGASKAWVNAFTRACATEGKPDGIKVFGVAPGAVETDMLRGLFPDFPKDQTVTPDHVAAMIEWLLDERCRYSTGQIVDVRK